MNKGYLSLIIAFFCSFSACKVLKDTAVSYNETSSGLKYRVLDSGNEKFPEEGDYLTIHYVAKLEDGQVFDDTYKRNEPLIFKIGKGHVIKGWEEGLLLISQGAKAEFLIPPHLAYGEKGVDDKVPPNATVIFTIELIDIEKPKKPHINDKEEFQATKENIQYNITEHGTGKEIEKGYVVKTHYRGYFEDGEVFDNSYERDEPFEFMIGEGMVIEGWDIAFEKLREGDKATLWIPHNLAYGKTGRGPIPPEANIMFDVEVLEVLKPKMPEPFEVEGLDTIQTLTGIEYLILEEGSYNIKPETDDIVVIHYTGYLEDGNIFDSSVKRGQPFRFVVGGWQVIHGLDEAIRLLRKGSKARIIIPPNLAYGDKQVGKIPPNSTLIFDVELIDIIK